MNRFFLIAAFLLVLCGPSSAQRSFCCFNNIFHVDSSTGSDTNPGTAALPFATLQRGADATRPGSTVVIHPGSGYGGGTGGATLLTISTSGTGPIANSSQCTSPITFTAAPGTNPVLTGTQGYQVIRGINPISCIVINGLTLAGWNSSLTWAGASANAGAGSALTNNIYIGGGIAFQGAVGGTTSTSPHHITITNNIVHDFPGGGIACSYCDYFSVIGNIVHDNSLYSPWANSGISLYDTHNIDSGTGEKLFVTNNISYNNINYIPEHSIISGTTTANGSTASGNTTINVASITNVNFNQTPIHVTGGCIPPNDFITFFGAGFIVIAPTATTCTINNGDSIQFGYITDGEGIIIDNNNNSQSDNVPYVGRTLVADNILYNNGYSGISYVRSNNVDVINNTLYENQAAKAVQGCSCAPGEIANLSTNGSTNLNNISYSLSGGPSGWDQQTGTTTWTNNSFFGGNGAHTLPGTSNVLTDPKLVSPTTNFQLQGGSPAIGTGVTSSLVPNNFLGLPFASPPNIGAY